MKNIILFAIFVLVMLMVSSCKKNISPSVPTGPHPVYYRLVHYDLNGDSVVSKIVVTEE